MQVCVVSRGSKPCLVQSNTGEKVVAATPEVKVKDTVGAGDCFAAGFLHAYLAGASLKVCSGLLSARGRVCRLQPLSCRICV